MLSSSVELIHEIVAVGASVGELGHPVTEDDGVIEWPESNVDVADAHSVEVDEPAEEPETAKTLYFLHNHILIYQSSLTILVFVEIVI